MVSIEWRKANSPQCWLKTLDNTQATNKINTNNHAYKIRKNEYKNQASQVHHHRNPTHNLARVHTNYHVGLVGDGHHYLFGDTFFWADAIQPAAQVEPLDARFG